MQYLIAINQTRALEWGLNAQQAMLFAFLHQVPTWARARQIDGQTFFNISKTKIVEELPLLTDKPDTAYRMMRALAKLGLLEMTSCDNKTYMRLTPKGITWNRSKGSEINPTPEGEEEGSEKNPTSDKSPSRVGKRSEGGSEKSPTNQGTNISTPSPSDAGESNQSIFERAAQQTDDGTPPPQASEHRQHPMSYDWQPDTEQLAMACFRRGLPTDTQPDAGSLADFTAHFAEKPSERRTAQGWHERLAKWLAENRQRQPLTQTATGTAAQGDRHAQRCTTGPGHDPRAERQRIADQLSNPQDTSWADGLWPEDDDAEHGAQAGDHFAGGSGVHPAGSALSEDVLECVPECEAADAGTPGIGAGAGALAGHADPAGGRAGDERSQASGEYLAADDPGAGLNAGAQAGGLRYAGDW